MIKMMGKDKGPGAICGKKIDAENVVHKVMALMPTIKRCVDKLDECDEKNIITNFNRVIIEHAKAAHYNITGPITVFNCTDPGMIYDFDRKEATTSKQVHDDIVDDVIKDHYKELSLQDQRINNNKQLCDENRNASKIHDDKIKDHYKELVDLRSRLYIAENALKQQGIMP